MLRVVGFDLDMTLIDSRPQILAAFRALSEEKGVSIDLLVVEARLGLKLEDELHHWFHSDQVETAAAIYRKHYIRLAAATIPLPGALEAIATVRKSGAQVAIVTAKHRSSVEPCLQATGISPDTLHAFVHGSEKATVLRSIGASIYAGDNPDDMRAAQSAGATGIGVTTGVFSRDELTGSGAVIVLSSLEQFATAYRSLT